MKGPLVWILLVMIASLRRSIAYTVRNIDGTIPRESPSLTVFNNATYPIWIHIELDVRDSREDLFDEKKEVWFDIHHRVRKRVDQDAIETFTIPKNARELLVYIDPYPEGHTIYLIGEFRKPYKNRCYQIWGSRHDPKDRTEVDCSSLRSTVSTSAISSTTFPPSTSSKHSILSSSPAAFTPDCRSDYMVPNYNGTMPLNFHYLTVFNNATYDVWMRGTIELRNTRKNEFAAHDITKHVKKGATMTITVPDGAINRVGIAPHTSRFPVTSISFEKEISFLPLFFDFYEDRCFMLLGTSIHENTEVTCSSLCSSPSTHSTPSTTSTTSSTTATITPLTTIGSNYRSNHTLFSLDRSTLRDVSSVTVFNNATYYALIRTTFKLKNSTEYITSRNVFKGAIQTIKFPDGAEIESSVWYSDGIILHDGDRDSFFKPYPMKPSKELCFKLLGTFSEPEQVEVNCTSLPSITSAPNAYFLASNTAKI